MNKETITFKQAIYTTVLFIFGSSLVVGVSGIAKQDSWISLLLAMAASFPLLMMYARIMHLLPETDLYDIWTILFGKIIGKIITALFTWYAIHLSALVIRNFSEFQQIVSMPETPQLPIMATLALLTAYLGKSSTAVLGKWSSFIFPIVIFVILITTVLSIKVMDLTNVLPILENGWTPIFKGTFEFVTFPFAETVLFLTMANAVKKTDSPYKIFGRSLLIGGISLAFVIIRNVIVIGQPMIDSSYFPSYSTARVLSLGDFLSRIEGSITMNFLLTGILKISVCLMAGTKGIAKLFNIEVHKNMLLPTTMLALALCAIVYNNAMEMFDFIKYFNIYAVPFQIIIPVATWIAAEIHMKRQAPATKMRQST